MNKCWQYTCNVISWICIFMKMQGWICMPVQLGAYAEF
jgi:hypothetical protein